MCQSRACRKVSQVQVLTAEMAPKQMFWDKEA